MISYQILQNQEFFLQSCMNQLLPGHFFYHCHLSVDLTFGHLCYFLYMEQDSTFSCSKSQRVKSIHGVCLFDPWSNHIAEKKGSDTILARPVNSQPYFL